MMRAGDLDYGLARVSARFGGRPDEPAWRSLTVIRGMPALIEAAHSAPFRHWIAGIAPDAGPHAIERSLRSNWRALVDEVRLWMPGEWQGALAWAGMLIELPIVQYLARNGAPYPWMDDDPIFRDLCGDVAAPDSNGPLAALASAWPNPDGFMRAWRDEWRRQVPRDAQSALLDELGRVLERHRGLHAEPAVGDGTLDRHALAARLVLIYRRATSDPAAIFTFLALSVLDMERLRGELLRRALFAELGVVA